MKKRRLLARRTEVQDPHIIYPVSSIRPDGGILTNYETRVLVGKFYRVIPNCWRDIEFLQSLPHRVRKWAPAHGDGLIIDMCVVEDLA